MADIERLSYGQLSAENDSALGEYFIETETYKRFRDGTKSIALGNRGAGKSAIFQMLAEHERNHGNMVIELSPEDYSYQFLSEVTTKEERGSWAKQTSYAAAWKYLLYVMSMKEVTNKHKGLKVKGYAKIYNYLRDNHAGTEKNPIGTLISYLKRLEDVKLGADKVGVKLKSRELEKLYKLEEINQLLPFLNDLCERFKLSILIDELDKGWDKSEDAVAFVAGLFDAAMHINRKTPNIRVLLSLRSELYDNIPSLYGDAEKVRDKIEIIEWDEIQLKAMITKRIAYHITELKNRSADEVWNSIFAETLDYRRAKSYNYVVDRTLYRPRELIQFCSDISDRMKDNNECPATYTTITEAELSYSQKRVKDIAAEYSFQHPGIGSVIETFRGLQHNLDRDNLELHCMEIIVGDKHVDQSADWVHYMDTDKVIEVLWNVGFLKAHAVGGIKARRRSGSEYVGSYQVQNINLKNINRFQIHAMFRSYLGTKEK